MLLNVACIQCTTTDQLEENILMLEAQIRRAVAAGAELVALPENAFYLRAPGAEIAKPFFTVQTHPAVAVMRALAGELGVSILIGSVAVVEDARQEKLFNRSLLIGASGEIVAQYDKIHLFDATLSNGETYAESTHFAPGSEVVTAQVKDTTLGLTVCYDVRFPALYRMLAQRGAEIITVPAAFTYTTGSAHWHVLLRARAIEIGSFVLAPAQCGTHPGGRRTYGHSLIIGLWGEILAEAGEEPGIIHATLDLAQAAEMRARIPNLRNDRFGVVSL